MDTQARSGGDPSPARRNLLNVVISQLPVQHACLYFTYVKASAARAVGSSGARILTAHVKQGKVLHNK